MAETMSKDPAFAQMTAALQQSFGAGGGMPGMPGMPSMPGMPGGEGGAQFDPSQYMQAMSGVLQNPNFMQMAEKLGTQIMSVRGSPTRTALSGTCLLCLNGH